MQPDSERAKIRALPWALFSGKLNSFFVETPWMHIDGYTVMFGAAFLFLAAGGLLYRRVRPDDRHTTRTAVRSFLNRIAQR